METAGPLQGALGSCPGHPDRTHAKASGGGGGEKMSFTTESLDGASCMKESSWDQPKGEFGPKT